MSAPIQIGPQHFGPARYGVHVSADVDDWGWTAYGHPDPWRLLAAISQLTTELGVHEELVEQLADGPLVIEQRWAVNFRQDPSADFAALWDWCDKGTPGAVAITEVTL
ncbi:hypothetical protein ACWESM_18675 [Nocardia sp. NPDC003999]